MKYLYEFFLFGCKQAYASIFGGIILFFILLTSFYYPLEGVLHRYDFLFLVCIVTQLLLILFKLEEKREFWVILLFHIVGTVMEIYKIYMGSWIYPESGLLTIGNVPLFTGFMYSAIGSYIARSWRIFNFSFNYFPNIKIFSFVCLLIYINFFTHHFFWDIRPLLFGAIFVLFYKSWIFFTVHTVPRKMPSLVAAFLLSFFIWIAENIGTITNTGRCEILSCYFT